MTDELELKRNELRELGKKYNEITMKMSQLNKEAFELEKAMASVEAEMRKLNYIPDGDDENGE
ncbi:MAG: hypothetical protein AABY22_15620 [Nanoarchaeota archaeon]